MVAAGKGRRDVVLALLSGGADTTLVANNGWDAAAWASHFGHTNVVDDLRRHQEQMEDAEENAVDAVVNQHYQISTNTDEIDIQLIVSLLEYICYGGEGAGAEDSKNSKYSKYSSKNSNTEGRSNSSAVIEGAILVFLPGWDDILKAKDALEQHPQVYIYNNKIKKGHMRLLHVVVNPPSHPNPKP